MWQKSETQNVTKLKLLQLKNSKSDKKSKCEKNFIVTKLKNSKTKIFKCDKTKKKSKFDKTIKDLKIYKTKKLKMRQNYKYDHSKMKKCDKTQKLKKNH